MQELYGFIKGLGILIRLFYLPNPFEPLDGVMLFGTPIIAFWVNVCFEPILHLFAYSVVGKFYRSGSDPSFGSICYMVFYVLAVFLLYSLSWAVSFVLRIVG